MIKRVDARDLNKLDLELLTNKAQVKCSNCDGDFYLFNLKGAKERVCEFLENKLIYEGIDEKGEFECSYACECPYCSLIKSVQLKLNIAVMRQVYIFDCEVMKIRSFKIVGGEK